MPLTNTRYEFLALLLELYELQLNGELRAYLKAEAAAIDAVEQLKKAGAPELTIRELEDAVLDAQGMVNSASSESGTDVLTQARASMRDIALRAGQLARFHVGLSQALAQHASLVHPVIQADKRSIKAQCIDEAARLAQKGRYDEADFYFKKVCRDCVAAQKRADSYDQAFNEAKSVLALSRSTMLTPDVEIAQRMLDAAAAEAGAGRRHDALELITEVAPHCGAKRGNYLAPTQEEFRELVAHLDERKMAAEFRAEVANLSKLVDNLQRAADKGLLMLSEAEDGSKQFFGPTSLEVARCSYECDRLQRLAMDHVLFVEKLAGVSQLFEDMTEAGPADSNAFIVMEVGLIELNIAHAKAWAARRSYKRADSMLDESIEVCEEAASVKSWHAECTGQVNDLAQRMDRVGAGIPGTPSAEEAAFLSGLMHQAKAAVAGRDRKRAEGLLQLLAMNCRRMEDFAAASARSEVNVRRVFESLAGPQATTPAEAVHKAREEAMLELSKLAEELGKRTKHAGFIPKEMSRITARIEAARQQPDQARVLLEEVAGDFVVVEQLFDRCEACLRRCSAIQRQRNSLGQDNHPVVLGMLAEIDNALRRSVERVQAQSYAAAFAGLDGVEQQMMGIEEAKKQANAIAIDMNKLRGDVATLTGYAPRDKDPHIGLEIGLLDNWIHRIEAQLMTPPLVLKEIREDLERASARHAELRTLKLVRTPGSAESAIAGQLVVLDQLNRLDGVVKALTEPSHALAALKVRFGLDGVVDEAAGTPDAARVQELQRLYFAMAEVPAHAKDNSCLQKVTRTVGGFSFYDANRKQVTVAGGQDFIDREKHLGDIKELPDVLDICKIVPDPKPKSFQFSTWHEVAHALDERDGIMRRLAGDPGFGAWCEHGGNVMHVAQVVAKAFGFPDALLLAKFLGDGIQPKPEPENWEPVRRWSEKARDYAKPWLNGEWCSRDVTDKKGGLVVDGRIFHESYPDEWVSYEASSRRQGVSGYQFRASGEWFAELYAAYVAKKLPQSHPKYAWMERLVFG